MMGGMKVILHKKFKKRYSKLGPRLQAKVKKRLTYFMSNPYAKVLRNHRLSGRLAGLRAISVTGDVRIIFEEQNGYAIVIMLDVGTHNQVY
jgi:addiction module RelE/StbE family toxin